MLLEWRNRPHFRRHFREYRELSMVDQLIWYEDTVRNDARTKMFAVTALNTGALIGACGLCWIDLVNRNADLSIYIGADDIYIDNIFAPDTAYTLLRYAFDELGLHRVWVEIYDFDEAKKKLFDCLNFKFDGRHRDTLWRDGTWHDSIFYSLLPQEIRDPSEQDPAGESIEQT